MGRAPCCDKANVKKGPWSPEEDAKLKDYIEKYGTGGNWIALPQKIGLKRCGKSCRLRWLNYLRPNIKHGGFTEEEDNIICSLYISIGSRWSIIAAQLPGRTDNDIKNYWNTRLKKKLLGRRKQSNTLAGRYSTGNPDSRDAEDPPSLSNSAIERLQLHMQLQGLHYPLSFYSNPALWPKIHPLQEKMAQLLKIGNPSNNSNPNPNLIMPQESLPTSQHEESEQRAFYEPMISDSLKITSSKIDELVTSLSGMSSSPNDSAVDPFSYESFMPRVDVLEQPYLNNNPPIPTMETAGMGGNNNNIVDNEKGGFMSPEEGQMADLNYFKDSNGSRDNLLWWSNALDMKFAPSMSMDSINTAVNPQSQEMFQDYEICSDDHQY